VPRRVVLLALLPVQHVRQALALVLVVRQALV
jgi:hypothetical protein